MGRVYNALVRAERWDDAGRPIGRPAPPSAQPGRRVDAPQVFSVNPSPTFEDNFVLAEDLVTPASAESPIAAEAVEAAPVPVSASAFEPRAAVALAPSPVSECPAPSLPMTFEEPITVSNISKLTIDPHLAALTGEDSWAVERYRALSVKLLSLAHQRKLKTLLITSAEAGEGKTTVATCAAWSLAKHPERRVLLIDANPASSSIGGMLGIDAKRGWLNLADGSSDLKHALVRLDPNGLYVLTPGAPATAQSIDALSSRLEDVIAELAPRFDLVVVDSGSILESSETQRLAAILDGAVIVARANSTHRGKVNAARKLVPKERRLGVVLNDTEADVAYRRSEKKSLLGRGFRRKR